MPSQNLGLNRLKVYKQLSNTSQPHPYKLYFKNLKLSSGRLTNTLASHGKGTGSTNSIKSGQRTARQRTDTQIDTVA